MGQAPPRRSSRRHDSVKIRISSCCSIISRLLRFYRRKMCICLVTAAPECDRFLCAITLLPVLLCPPHCRRSIQSKAERSSLTYSEIHKNFIQDLVARFSTSNSLSFAFPTFAKQLCSTQSAVMNSKAIILGFLSHTTCKLLNSEVK